VEATFIELPAFERHREDYLDDNGFRALQNLLMKHPEAGDLIPDTGGLRKLRFRDVRRGKGKRGGLRVIYPGGILDFSSGFSLYTTRMRWRTSHQSNAEHSRP
jgi:hypothetical protein